MKCVKIKLKLLKGFFFWIIQSDDLNLILMKPNSIYVRTLIKIVIQVVKNYRIGKESGFARIFISQTRVIWNFSFLIFQN